MKIVKPEYEILDSKKGIDILKSLERAGRVCYKSEDKITDDSCKDFVKRLIKRGHEAMIEHEKISVKIICNRGVSHELVRHRLASWAQESTRYCSYDKNKFGNEITVIEPLFFPKNHRTYNVWKKSCEHSEKEYFELLSMGASAQEARDVLPNALKTEIIMTANIREWRHFFRLRTAKAAHPQMREITVPMLKEFHEKYPVLFDDIEV